MMPINIVESVFIGVIGILMNPINPISILNAVSKMVNGILMAVAGGVLPKGSTSSSSEKFLNRFATKSQPQQPVFGAEIASDEPAAETIMPPTVPTEHQPLSSVADYLNQFSNPFQSSINPPIQSQTQSTPAILKSIRNRLANATNSVESPEQSNSSLGDGIDQERIAKVLKIIHKHTKSIPFGIEDVDWANGSVKDAILFAVLFTFFCKFENM